MSASIKKKSKPKSDKVATNNNKQQQTTNNKRPFFLPKINKVFLRPILQNLKGRSVLDKIFFENDPFDEPNQMPPSKKFYILSKLVKNAKWWSKSSLPLSHSTAKFFPLKKGFKKATTGSPTRPCGLWLATDYIILSYNFSQIFTCNFFNNAENDGLYYKTPAMYEEANGTMTLSLFGESVRPPFVYCAKYHGNFHKIKLSSVTI